MQGIYLGYMYSRWRKIRGLDKDDPIKNTGQMQSSFKDFEKNAFMSPSLKPKNIRDISIAGFGRDFDVDLTIKDIALF